MKYKQVPHSLSIRFPLVVQQNPCEGLMVPFYDHFNALLFLSPIAIIPL